MSSDLTRTDCLRLIRRSLVKRGFKRARRLDTFKQAKGPRYLVAPKLRFAHHFDIEPSLALCEPFSQIFGIVHILDDQKISKNVHKAVIDAAYLRHLLARKAYLQRHRAPTVELVLVSYRAQSSDAAADEIHSVLRKSVREGDVLHAIGVGHLHLTPNDRIDGTVFEAAFRRAFPWLLCAVQTWFAQEHESTATAASFGRLESLTLNNFRIRGSRTFEFCQSDHLRLHLAHGHNGSGKSSLSEAIELIRTGKIERLGYESETDYAQILCHSKGDGGASLIPKVACTSDPETLLINQQGCEIPWHKCDLDRHPASFRLDQTVMDYLTRPENKARRADTFLKAFFAEEAEVGENYRIALQRVKECLGNLSEDLRFAVSLPDPEHLEESQIEGLRPKLEKIFGLLDQDSSEIDAAAAEHLLPLPMDVLETLAPLSTDLKSRLQSWKGDRKRARSLRAAVAEIQSLIEPLAQRRFDSLQDADRILKKLGGWEVETYATGIVDFKEAIDTWMELTAKVDLADRQIQVSETLLRASDRGWKLENSPFPHLDRPAVEKLEKSRESWAAERNALHQQLTRSASESDLSNREDPTDQQVQLPTFAPPVLRSEEIAVLNTVGSWIEAPDLGSKIRDALRDGQAVDIDSTLTIGTGGWNRLLIGRLDTLREAVKQLRQRRSGLPDRVVALLQSAQSLEVQHDKLRDSFLEKIRGDQSLNHALNELLALFTPARWAYEDIQIDYDHLDRNSVGMKTRSRSDDASSDIDTRLNTAELNLFVVALFLLCAPRQRNPLGLLILDDPLQNMDELTVSTLARGIAKVSLLWPEGCQALFLFHGEDDMERFRREMPAAVYLLPWLNPSGEDPQAITPDVGLSTNGQEPLPAANWDLEFNSSQGLD